MNNIEYLTSCIEMAKDHLDYLHAQVVEAEARLAKAYIQLEDAQA